MSKMNRYVQVIDLYIYADSDVEAISQAMANVKILQELGDNNANTCMLSEQPFGTFKSRPIDFRGLGKTE